ncbi:MAG: hypothetical protein WDN49_01295 [Acetobacteraceae bacterium]
MLQRYELLFEAGLVVESHAEGREPCGGGPALMPGRPMTSDHRRILATGIARLRAKIKYRPVVFELMPPEFTLLQVAAQRRGDRRAPGPQAELPAADRAAGTGRGDRRRRAGHGRPAGQAIPVPPGHPGRARRGGNEAAAVTG